MAPKSKKNPNEASQMSPTEHEVEQVSVSELQQELGASWTPIFAWIIEEEYKPELQGSRGMKTYEEMRRSDSTVSALLLACTLPLRSTSRQVKPAEDDDGNTQDQDREIATFVEKALFDMMEQWWDNFLQEVMTFFAFWFSLFEKVYTIKEDKVWIKKLAFRKQNTIEQRQTSTGEPGVLQQLDTSKAYGKNKWSANIDIPANKLLRFTINQEWDNYEGISILRAAYKSWFIKSNLEKFDAVRHEKGSIWVPVIYIPSTASQRDKDEVLKILRNFKTNQQTGIVIPWSKEDGREFTFADLNKWGDTKLLESIKYHDRNIVKTVLAQWIELGATESGSRSLGESQGNIFLNAMEAFGKVITDTINRFLIPELVDLNFNNVERYPELSFTKIGDNQILAMTDAITQYVNAGVITLDDELERFMRVNLQLPPRDMETTDDDKKEPPQAKKEEKKEDTVTKKDEKEIEEDDDKKIEAHEHIDGDCGSCLDDPYFSELCSVVDNKMILDIQKQLYTEDGSLAKKKWLKFNDYEKKSPRPMTFAERKVNFVWLQRLFDQYETKLDGELSAIFKKQKADLVEQVAEAVRQNDVAAIGKIKAKFLPEMSSALTDIQKELFEAGKKAAAAEMAVKVPGTAAEVRGVMRVQNDALVAKVAADMENTAKLAATQVISSNAWSVTETGIGKVKTAVGESIDTFTTKAKNSFNTLTISWSINMGRATIFERYPEKVYAFQYSAILDDRTTDRCLSLDGRVVKAWSPAFIDYSPPQHYNCRSIWVEILEDEVFKPNITGIPSTIDPVLSIDAASKMTKPVSILKNSPAIAQIQQEIAEREAKLEELKKSWQFPNRQKDHENRIKQLKNSIKGKFTEHIMTELKKKWLRFTAS